MEVSMLVSLLMIYPMDLVNSSTLIKINMLEISFKVEDKAKQNIFIVKGQFLMECGKMIVRFQAS